MNIDDRRLPYPDTCDLRQANRSGKHWPTHKARARGRKNRRHRKETTA